MLTETLFTWITGKINYNRNCVNAYMTSLICTSANEPSPHTGYNDVCQRWHSDFFFFFKLINIKEH